MIGSRNVPPISTKTAGREVVYLPYDFNVPPNEAGYYKAVVDETVREGDTVVLDGWADTGPRLRCRVRAVIAVLEPIGDFEPAPEAERHG